MWLLSFLLALAALMSLALAEVSSATLWIGDEETGMAYAAMVVQNEPLNEFQWQASFGYLVQSEPPQACVPLTLDAELAHAVVLVQAGGCAVAEKLANVRAAGAPAAILDMTYVHLLPLQEAIRDALRSSVTAVFVDADAMGRLVADLNAHQKEISEGEDAYPIAALPVVLYVYSGHSARMAEVWGALSMGVIFIVLWLLLQCVVCVAQRSPCCCAPPGPQRVHLSDFERGLPCGRYGAFHTLKHDTCIICIETFALSDKVRVLPCDHGYHQACIDEWLRLRHACPLCKHDTTRAKSPPAPTETTTLLSV